MKALIRRTLITALTLATVVTGVVYSDSYRKRPSLFSVRGFPGWCADWKLGGGWGVHMLVRAGGVCFAYRDPVDQSGVPGDRYFILTGNLGYGRHLYKDFKPCPLNAEHCFAEPAGKVIVVHSVCVPLWLCLVVVAVYPSVAFLRGPLRTWRRRRSGACLQCGYNLRGNESGVCPECGTRRR